MKTKMEYSTTKISPAKMNSSAGKALVKSPKLGKSQQKAEEVCQMYFMQLRSGLIKKTACYFKKETTKRHSTRREYSASLSTYNDQSITFVFEDGSYEIYVEDLGKDQEKDKVLFRYYDFQPPSRETGDADDGHTLLVNLSPTKDKDFLLHANNKEHSVELQKCGKPLPDQAFFRLHRKSSKCVSFECKNDPGVFIGVKDNHLALIKVEDQTEYFSTENIIFKLS
ncbi:interleukin-33 isoform X3 [Panthera tigris]|uniref:interleukin-33 isoform X3 n=1 Tax=Panthera leo TaxID=9689 RepID=UPI000F2E8213|nr:interleukin-33 isoform X3 [Panthera leo]XP_042820795.1 interleukin-33 isoform X3 [Panthera tigris]XP_049490491.1 interleukin-33 isoform X2 [Panthera uncia]